MLNATQLRNGTRFSASGQIGVFKKIGQNEDGTITATLLFGSDPQEVGKEVSLPGNLPCYYLPETSNAKERPAERKVRNEHKERRRGPKNPSSDANAINIVDHNENIITVVNKPSAQLSNSILGADSYKIDGKKYTVDEIAYDFDSGDTFVVVTE